MKVVWVAIGGALGSVLRYLWVEFFYALGVRAFPFGILSVNILGSFLMGFFSIWLISKFGSTHLIWRAAIMVGVLGGFTTFSSFSLDVVNFFQEGLALKAMLYIVISLICCFLATFGGILLARVMI